MKPTGLKPKDLFTRTNYSLSNVQILLEGGKSERLSILSKGIKKKITTSDGFITWVQNLEISIPPTLQWMDLGEKRGVWKLQVNYIFFLYT